MMPNSMNRRLSLWPCIGLLLLAFAPAPRAAALKVGVVDVNRVLQDAPQSDAARRRIEKEFAPRDRALLAEQMKIRKAEDNLIKNGAMLTPDQRTRREMELASKKRNLRRAQADFRDDLNVRRNEELSKLQRLVVDTIQNLAKADKYDLVIGEGVIYAGQRVDITGKVIARLQALYKKKTGH